jgi:hypothetical protein
MATVWADRAAPKRREMMMEKQKTKRRMQGPRTICFEMRIESGSKSAGV